jgi:putative NADH-flavin reductase
MVTERSRLPGREPPGNAFQAARTSCGPVVCIAHDGERGEFGREHEAVATVLIIGASRGIGLETVKTALEAGHSVRALSRSARRIPIDRPKLEKMVGDALEMVTVRRALSGVDIVIQSLGVSPGPEIIFKPTQLFSKATRVLVTAMEQAHIKRLICVTGFGAGDSRGYGGLLYNLAFHLLLGRVYDDKDVQEWIIRRSKLDWVIVRPVILTDGPKTNAYRALIDPRDWTCGFISRADVADFLVKQIDDDTFLHKTPVLRTSLPTSRSEPMWPPHRRAA